MDMMLHKPLKMNNEDINVFGFVEKCCDCLRQEHSLATVDALSLALALTNTREML